MKYILNLLLIVAMVATMTAFTSDDTENLRTSLIEYSIEDQKLFYVELDADTQADLWRHKLTLEAKNYEGEQKAFILFAADNVSSNWNTEQLNLVKQEMKELFTRAESIFIFNTLYVKGEYEKLRGQNTAGPAAFGDCECSVDYGWGSDFCPDGQFCALTSCELSLFGCGWLWGELCDGSCVRW